MSRVASPCFAAVRLAIAGRHRIASRQRPASADVGILPADARGSVPDEAAPQPHVSDRE